MEDTPMKKTTLLVIEVEYDDEVTDAESVAAAADTLLETALSTPGILDEYGNPSFDRFQVGQTHPVETSLPRGRNQGETPFPWYGPPC
jgi:hypothetical protein